MLTIVIAIIAILFSYYAVISKKPRIFLKIVPAFKDNVGVHLNLKISNSGDKPAFDIKLTLNNDIENFISDGYIVDKEERLKRSEKNSMIDEMLKDLRKNIGRTSEVNKFKLMELLGKRDDFFILKKTEENFIKCFGNNINFISGGESENLFLGISSFNKGFLRTKFKINVSISFYEELKIDFFSKQFLKTFFSFLDICSKFSIMIQKIIIGYLYFLRIYFINSYFKIDCRQTIVNFLLDKQIRIDINNSRIIINYNYNYIVNFDSDYPVEASYSSIEKKIDILCNYIYDEKKYLFFNSEIYKNWESTLTKDELKIMSSYKIIYGHNYDKYIELYSIMYEDNCDEKIKNKIGFKEKYKKFMILLYKSELLSIEQTRNFNFANAVYKDKGVL